MTARDYEIRRRGTVAAWTVLGWLVLTVIVLQEARCGFCSLHF